MGILDDVATRLEARAEPPPARTSPADSVHTLYMGAHRITPDVHARVGDEARAAFETHAPDGAALADALGWSDDALAQRVHGRVAEKLAREPLEDLRIDFEDGYPGGPSDEDAHALAAADAMAAGRPRRFGLRIKPFTAGRARRSLATLERFCTRLAEREGRLPAGFVITLPKATEPDQARALVEAAAALEDRLGSDGGIALEMMVEVPWALFDPHGRLTLPALVEAAGERLVGIHLGVFDYTAAAEVPAPLQGLAHPSCDFVRSLLTVAYGGRGLTLSSGSTNVLPTGDDVQQAWRRSADDIRHALERGYPHGWDLHPAQLPVRFAAVYRHYLEGLDRVVERLCGYIEAGGAATDTAATLDDAPTSAALWSFVRRAITSGAVDPASLPAPIARDQTARDQTARD
ncbi:MAG: hypothetical protein NXI35_12770 [bacterium]|nr:hypothetical protein [bacterium]